MDRDKVIELVKALDITAEELGIQPEVKSDEVFVQNVKEFIELYNSKEKAKEFFSNEYYELLGFKEEEEKKYKLVELQLAKTIYKNVQVILDMDESDGDAFRKGDDYADFDYNLSVDYPYDEDCWEEDNVRIIEEDLTKRDIAYSYDPEAIWNYEEIEEDC